MKCLQRMVTGVYGRVILEHKPKESNRWWKFLEPRGYANDSFEYHLLMQCPIIHQRSHMAVETS